MCKVLNYSIIIKKNIIYKNRIQTAEISIIISSKIENVKVCLRTINLDKIWNSYYNSWWNWINWINILKKI